MDENNAEIVPIQKFNKLVLPAFGKSPALNLEMDVIREAESRLIEAKTVNPATYTDLEYSFNCAYRDLKRHLSAIGYQITQAEKMMTEAKSDVFLGSYPEYLKENNIKAAQNNADLREAFLIRDEAYCAALDRYNQLKALESNFDGKVKVLENVCRFMRQKMQLLIRGGAPTDPNYYITSGRK